MSNVMYGICKDIAYKVSQPNQYVRYHEFGAKNKEDDHGPYRSYTFRGTCISTLLLEGTVHVFNTTIKPVCEDEYPKIEWLPDKELIYVSDINYISNTLTVKEYSNISGNYVDTLYTILSNHIVSNSVLSEAIRNEYWKSMNDSHNADSDYDILDED